MDAAARMEREFTQQIERWCWASLLVWLTGFFLFPTREAHNLFLYVFLLVPLLLFALPLRRVRLDWREPSFVLLLAFCGWSLTSVAWRDTGPERHLLYFVKVGLFGIGLVLLLRWLLRPVGPRVDSAVRWVAVVAPLSAAVYVLKDWAVTGFPAGRLWPHAAFSEIIDTSMVYGFGALALLWQARSAARRQGMVWYAGLAVVLWLMLLNQSRGPLLAFTATACALPLLQRPMRKRHAAVLLVLALLALGVLFDIALGGAFVQRVLTGTYLDRWQIWSSVLAMQDGHWLLGYGLGNEVEIVWEGRHFNHAHNLFLDTLQNTGLIGLLLLGAMLVLLLWRLWRVHTPAAHFVGLWLVYGLLCQMTSGQIPLTRLDSEWITFWVPLAFAFGVIADNASGAIERSPTVTPVMPRTAQHPGASPAEDGP
jgi:O-antigen ligase